MALTFTTPLRISPDPDNNATEGDGVAEAYLCHLGNGICAAAYIGSYSETYSVFGLDLSGPNPAVGPVAWFNYPGGESSWMDPEPPVDPKTDPDGYASASDINAIVPISGNRFAIIPKADAEYDANGNPGPYGSVGYMQVASFFEVNPVDLTVTRIAFCVAPTSTNGSPWTQECTAYPWGDKVVITSDDFKVIWIASPDSSVQVINLPSDATCPSAIVVAGNYAYYVDRTPNPNMYSYVRKVDLNSGAVTNGPPMTGFGTDNWTFFGCALPDGRLAWISDGGVYNAGYGPVTAVVIDPDSLVSDGPWQVWDKAETTGWTGGWYSNTRSLDAWPDGTLLVGYASRPDAGVVLASPDGTVQSTIPLPSSVTNGYWSYQAVSLGQGRVAVLYGNSDGGSPGVPSPFGAYITYTPPVAMLGGPVANRRAFRA